MGQEMVWSADYNQYLALDQFGVPIPPHRNDTEATPLEPTQLDRIEEKLDQLLAKKKPVKPRSSKKHEYDPKFEAIWRDCPKVAGENKADTYAQYNKRLSETDKPLALSVTIHMAVIKYGEFCKATGRWLMSPQAFMGYKKHYELDWTIPTQADNVPTDDTKLQLWAAEHGYRGAWAGESHAAYRRALKELHRSKS